MDDESEVVDVTRRGVKLVGTAYDINRVLEACKNAIKTIEQNRIDVGERRTVVVRPPHENEP